jgi:hypothetical protein
MKSRISLLLLILTLAASSTVTAPCQRLQQFHHPWFLRLYHSRTGFPPERVYTTHRWPRQDDV